MVSLVARNRMLKPLDLSKIEREEKQVQSQREKST